jgi:hypothetical protein
LVLTEKFPGIGVDLTGKILVVVIVVSEFDVVNWESGFAKQVSRPLYARNGDQFVLVADVDCDRRFAFGLVYD